MSKNAHFKSGAVKPVTSLSGIQFGNTRFAHTHTHTATALPATLAMLLSELVDTGGDVRTTKRLVVNIVVNGGESGTFIKHHYSPPMRFCAHPG